MSEGTGGRVSVGQRIEDLLDDMTLDEKLAQLGGVWSTDLIATRRHRSRRQRLLGGQGRHGRCLTAPDRSPGSPRPPASGPLGLAMLANDIQRWLVNETRLGIPAIIHEEADRGLLRPRRGAVPAGDRAGVDVGSRPRSRRRRAHAARDARRGGPPGAAPVLDIARDPRWGRVEETYGEDPVLVGELGSAYVRGLQSTGGPDDGRVGRAPPRRDRHRQALRGLRRVRRRPEPRPGPASGRGRCARCTPSRSPPRSATVGWPRS